jgi:thiopurine S-methyltransferase
MNEKFWLDKWEHKEIGFHQKDVNEDLRNFWQSLDPEPDEIVFVPLCGKSHDMLWLREQGHEIVGVELSRVAVSSFFSENGMTPTWTRHGSFDVAAADGIRILCGNIFDLTADDLESVTCVYDRAALVALPAPMREKYVAHLLSILERGMRLLLVTLDYRQDEMNGPPFAVPADEVERLYSKSADIRLLSRRDILAEEPNFARRGITSLYSCAFRLTM